MKKEDQSFSLPQLTEIWQQFLETKKDQAAEFHLLSHPYELNGTIVTLQLTNPIEEPLLESLRLPLVEYLREQLRNGSIQVRGILKTVDSKRMAYTNKEKFDLLAEKNPMLLELKNRMGLDPDF